MIMRGKGHVIMRGKASPYDKNMCFFVFPVNFYILTFHFTDGKIR